MAIPYETSLERTENILKVYRPLKVCRPDSGEVRVGTLSLERGIRAPTTIVLSAISTIR